MKIGSNPTKYNPTYIFAARDSRGTKLLRWKAKDALSWRKQTKEVTILNDVSSVFLNSPSVSFALQWRFCIT